MDDTSSGLERTPVYSLTKEGDCSDVPTLKINKLKNGCGMKGPSGGCLSDPKTNVNYYSTGFNVYFDGQATAQPAALIEETSDAAAAEAPAASEISGAVSGNNTAPSAPSAAAMPLVAFVSVVCIAVSAIITMF